MAVSGAQPLERQAEVEVANSGVEQGGFELLYNGDVLCWGGAGVVSIWVVDVGYVPAYWEDTGRITPQGGPQTDGAATEEVT